MFTLVPDVPCVPLALAEVPDDAVVPEVDVVDGVPLWVLSLLEAPEAWW